MALAALIISVLCVLVLSLVLGVMFKLKRTAENALTNSFGALMQGFSATANRAAETPRMGVAPEPPEA